MSKPAWSPQPPHCRHCGERIDTTVARVVGDNDGCVARCRQCADGLSRTTAAARAAQTDGFRVAPEGRR